MKPRQLFAVLVIVAFFGVPRARSDAQGASSPSHITSQGRMDVIRTFTTELVYIRASFPMGTRGLTLKDGNVSPSGDELQRLMAMWGPSAKAGDQALITAVLIK